MNIPVTYIESVLTPYEYWQVTNGSRTIAGLSFGPPDIDEETPDWTNLEEPDYYED